MVVLDYLRICCPDFWFMHNKYSKDIDTFLLENQDDIIVQGVYTAVIGGKIFWITNHPYASFSPTPCFDLRPSRLTVLRLGRKIKPQVIAEHQRKLGEFLK